MVERAGRDAKLAFKAHPHVLRHACGYALANKGRQVVPDAVQAFLTEVDWPASLLLSFEVGQWPVPTLSLKTYKLVLFGGTANSAWTAECVRTVFRLSAR